MLSWTQLSAFLQQLSTTFVHFVKARRREEAAFGAAALLLWLGYYFPTLINTDIKQFLESWRGLLIISGVLYLAGSVFFIYGIYRVSKLLITRELPVPKNLPSAIKGPSAFTPADGDLFRRLGREEELRRLLGFIEDDQIRLVVLMGASGVGKTSLLRAGLTNILKDKEIDYHYWEVVPTAPGDQLLRAIQESWHHNQNPDTPRVPSSLDDLVNPSAAVSQRKHVIVLDQFEQLHGSTGNNPILRLLRKVARESKPPHRVTWIIAFRREFRAEWEDLTMAEKERGVYPAELSLRAFTSEQAVDVISQLVAEAQLSVQRRIVDSLVHAATVDGEVSPVEIGIGLFVLAELHDRLGGQTLTLNDYQFAGGAEGLLTQYLNRCLESFSEPDRQTVINAMLALREPGTHQRLAEGRTCTQLASEIAAEPRRLQMLLDRLVRRDMRLLERIVVVNGESPRFRLPHERLIPALHRLAGHMLAEVDQTRLKIDNAFVAWRNSNQSSQYLLKTRDLRAAERYESKLFVQADPDKRRFMHLSRRRRTFRRLGASALAFCVLTAGWSVQNRYQRYEARMYLADNHYPPELYDWQHQLKVLDVKDEIDLQRFPWLRSDSLEELHLRVPAKSTSLNGLADLTRCRRLKKLHLLLGDSQITDLSPLSNLTGLTHLSLMLSSQITDLTPLSKLSGLTRLELALTDSKVTDLSSLAQLSSLESLRLSLNESASDLSFITHLSKLEQLQLTVPPEQFQAMRIDPSDSDRRVDLTPLEKLVNLKELELFGDYRPDLAPISRLRQLRQLKLIIWGLADLTFLPNLANLDALTLNLINSEIDDLTPLTTLTRLRSLDLTLGPIRVRDLTPLSKVPTLTSLRLALGNNNSDHDLTPLTELTALETFVLHIDGTKVTNLLPLETIARHAELKLNVFMSWPIDSQEFVTKVSELTSLKELHLSFNPREDTAVDLMPLARLSSLKVLSVSGFPRDQPTSLTPLSKLRELTHLNIRLENGTDLTPLSELGHLTVLELMFLGDQPYDLKPLSKLGPLTEFQLLTMQPVDLTPLSSIHSIAKIKLNFSNGQAVDLNPLASIAGLKHVELSVEKLGVDVTPLMRVSRCETLMLGLNTNQRVSLKALPPTVTNLNF